MLNTLGTFSIACLWLASWVGGAAIVGRTAKVYDFGISLTAGAEK